MGHVAEDSVKANSGKQNCFKSLHLLYFISTEPSICGAEGMACGPTGRLEGHLDPAVKHSLCSSQLP